MGHAHDAGLPLQFMQAVDDNYNRIVNEPEDVSYKDNGQSDARMLDSYGHQGGHSLPAGVYIQHEPLTSNHYIIANPLDQAAVDDIIYQSVCEARADMQPGGKLYVIMGENHGMPTHRMAQAALLDNLALANKSGNMPHGNLLYAVELPYNDIAKYARNVYNITSSHVGDILHRYDPNGSAYMRAVLSKNIYPYASLSRERAYLTCLYNKIPAVNIDLDMFSATSGDSYVIILSNEDPVLGLLFEDVANLNIALHASTGLGMLFRNGGMAIRAWEAAHKTHQADTIVISTGLSHVGGDVRMGHDYSASFTKMLSYHLGPNDKILPVTFNDSDYVIRDDVDRQMWQDYPDAVIINGASDKWFDNHLNVGRSQEKRFIGELRRSYNGRKEPVSYAHYNAKDIDQIRKRLTDLVIRATNDKFRSWQYDEELQM